MCQCYIFTLHVLLAGLAVLASAQIDNTTTAVSTDPPTVPATTLPIDQTFPSMCEVYDMVITGTTGSNTCTVNTDCSVLQCSLDIFQVNSPEFSATIVFLPCLETPSFRVKVFDTAFGNVVFEGLVSESQEIGREALFGTPLNLTIEQLEDGVGFEMSTEAMLENGTIQYSVLVPYAIYPEDSHFCSLSTCDVVTSLASGQNSQAQGGSCSLTSRCDGILCSIAPTDDPELTFDLTTRVIPCNDPPAVQLIISDPADGGRDLANQVLTNATTVEVFGIPIFVVVDQFNSALGVQIEVEQPAESEFGSPTRMSVLEYTYFPVSSEGQNCDVYSPTCLAFQGVVDKAVRSNTSCVTTENCDGVKCFLDVLGNGALFEATTNLICYNREPAFDLILREPMSDNGQEGDKLLDRVIHQSEHTIGILVYDIVVQLDRITEKNALGLQIMLSNKDEFTATPVVQYTEIPVDTMTLCKESGATLIQASLFAVLLSTIIGFLTMN